jgi:hypothetical protein
LIGIALPSLAAGPMPTSEHYRLRAEECRLLAEQAHDEHERATLLKVAEQWDRLAWHKTQKAAK